MIIPITTNTTIAICIQIQVGDIAPTAYFGREPAGGTRTARRNYLVQHAQASTRARGGACRRPVRPDLAGPGRCKPGGARSAVGTPPLGGVNIDGPGPPARWLKPIERSHRRTNCTPRSSASKSRGRLFEPRARGQRTRSALAFTDRLIGRRRRGRDPGDPVRRQHAVLGLVGARVGAARVRARESRHRATPGRRATRRDYAAFVAFLAQRYASDAGRDRNLERARPVQRRSISRARKSPSTTRRSCGPHIRRSSRSNPNVPVLAGSLVGCNGVFLRALYAAGIKGYYDGLAVHFYTLTLAARCARSTKSSSQTATPSRCGWTSSAGAAATRSTTSSRNRPA